MTTPRLDIRPDTFGRIIEGASGTIVFGNGVPAIMGEVVEVGEDYILFDEDRRAGRNIVLRSAVPLSAIAYFRYDDLG